MEIFLQRGLDRQITFRREQANLARSPLFRDGIDCLRALGARPYLVGEGGTLDECIRQFMHLSEAQRHLYEIHTAPQSDLVNAILSTDHVVELARSTDFLER